MKENGLVSKVETAFEWVAASTALAIGLMHIANISGLISLDTISIRVIHLIAMMIIVFTAPEKNKKSTSFDLTLRFVLMLVAIACTIYALFFMWPIIVHTGGSSRMSDAVVGAILVAVLLETCRRYLSGTLALVALLFLTYPFVANNLPGILHARMYSFTRVFTTMFASANAVYGIPMSVAATYVIMFSIFGAFLKNFNASDFMFRLSTAITRGMAGATAKTAVIFSLLIGMIIGSPAGNVAVTGSITIPMMKKRGYRKELAAAYEAAASTGGPLMPPVMGSAAFLMAEIAGVRYVHIMKAALLPALLYFLSIFFGIHFECKRTSIDCERIDSPIDKSAWEILKKGWFLMLPLVVMVGTLVIGYSPVKSAYYSSISLIALFVIQNLKFDKEVIKNIFISIKEGAMGASSMTIACGASGIIVGILAMTGLGSRLSTLIVTLSQGNLIITLLMVMMTALLLGMGMPISASYLVLASVAVPALIQLGQPVLASNLFVLFFACISAITPPVALASYVAAGLADADLGKVGWLAFRFGIVSFILPFMFIFGPALLMNGTWFEVGRAVLMGILGVFALAAANVGFLFAPLKKWERLVLFIGGLLMIDVNWYSDLAGGIIVISIALLNLQRKKEGADKNAVS